MEQEQTEVAEFFLCALCCLLLNGPVPAQNRRCLAENRAGAYRAKWSEVSGEWSAGSVARHKK
jgi:hypothetical protein